MRLSEIESLYNNGYGQAFDTGLYAQWTGAT